MTWQRHVAHRAGAEVLPRAPAERMVGLVVTGASAPGRSTDPSRARRARPASRSAGHALRPDRPVGPAVHLAHLPDRAGVEPLLHQPQALFRVALVAHLRHDLVLPRGLGQRPGLADGARQRLLHVDVLAELHRGHRDHGVVVIGRGDDAPRRCPSASRASCGSPCTCTAFGMLLERSCASPAPPWRPRSRRSRTARRCCRSSPRSSGSTCPCRARSRRRRR